MSISRSDRIMNYWLGCACTGIVSLSMFLGVESLKHVQHERHTEKKAAKYLGSSEKYAVLVSGYNEARFTYALSCISKFLVQTGFQRNYISILDMSQKKQGTRMHLQKKLEELAEVIDGDDLFVLHFSTHGERRKVDNQVESTLVLSFGIEDITERELQQYLARIKPKYGIVSTDSCYGGGIAKRMGKGNFIGVSGTQEDTVAMATFGDTFGLYFYCAFACPTLTDINKDGRVSVNEAFSYAKRMHIPARKGYFIPLLVSEQDVAKISLNE